jgi:catechol 2,3-dioxygenase-like lactoylglutathione lyase family enzyme
MRDEVDDLPLATWARLVPELSCRDFNRSLAFYTGTLGFRIAYEREGFVYLDRDGAQIMLEQENDYWTTGEREPPYGRGINFQIEVKNIKELLEQLKAHDIPLFRPVEDEWYRAGNSEVGNRQFLVQDPDGYLLRFFEDLGTRPITEENIP